MNATQTNPTESNYVELVDLLATYTEASNALSTLELDLQEKWMSIFGQHRNAFTRLQTLVSLTESRIRELAEANPEWFEKTKTLKTPYGTVSSRSSSKLVTDNEELSIGLIESKLADSPLYIRERKFLNLEALESLEDKDLAALRITRETTDRISVSPAKVDLGKAVKQAEAQKGGES